MDIQELTKSLIVRNNSKIVLLVIDGLGGIPCTVGGPTELEAANTPHLDALAKDSTCGQLIPVLPGITPGSGPGHFGLFGYDPLKYSIGRGVLEALGIDVELQAGDVAARGNFCTVNDQGVITDRRAGRVKTEVSRELVEKLSAIKQIQNVQIRTYPVREHRFVVVFRGPDLHSDVEDTDPGAVGLAPLEPKPLNPASEPTAKLISTFVTEARKMLKEDHPANMITLRGVSERPHIPTVEELFGVRAAAIAVYPMYRGLARLVGMTVAGPANDFAEELGLLKNLWDSSDYFFVHYKYTDSAGEDGNFDQKVQRLEDLDRQLPRILELRPDVLAVTGDHSTPAALAGHSWHPVPVLLSARTCRPDHVLKFDESHCLRGGLGTIEAKFLMPLLLAHAGRLRKFGA